MRELLACRPASPSTDLDFNQNIPIPVSSTVCSFELQSLHRLLTEHKEDFELHVSLDYDFMEDDQNVVDLTETILRELEPVVNYTVLGYCKDGLHEESLAVRCVFRDDDTQVVYLHLADRLACRSEFVSSYSDEDDKFTSWLVRGVHQPDTDYTSDRDSVSLYSSDTESDNESLYAADTESDSESMYASDTDCS